MQGKHKQIFVLTNTAKYSGRELLRGILSFASEHLDWNIHICEPTDEGFGTILDALASQDADGIISSEMEDEKVAKAFERSSVPLVVIGTRATCIPSRKHNIIFVTHDEMCLGAEAARYFIKLGAFRSCGYVHFKDPPYQHLSQLRESGFSAAMSEHDIAVSQFQSQTCDKTDLQQLGDWLKELPKPTCILAGYDKRAADVVYACERESIDIPGQVRLLGIDNDEFTCLSTSPKISSIATDLSLEGHTAAVKLNRLLKRRVAPCEPQTCISKTVCEVVPRESTSVLSPGIALVRRAKRYIEMNASRNLTVDEVIAHMRVSRALAYLRFREYAKQTILDAITAARIECVKQKLRSSKQSIDAVAASCGFTNANHLKTLFKKRCGMTMRDWRKGQCTSSMR